MEINRAVIELAYAVRRAVRPHLGLTASRLSSGTTDSGDVEFAIDEIAEHAIEDFIRKHDLSIAYYSEGRGLVEHGQPEHVLVIDPIDGTRPAMVGLEGSVVSIAVAPFGASTCFDDVTFGCILEMKQDRLFTAERGGMARICEGEKDIPVNLSLKTDPDWMSWSFELAGRPVELVTRVLGSLIDRSSVRGGVFVINSTAFSLTRLVSGQFDAVVDVSRRMLQEFPHLRPHFERAGMGRPLGLFPYDIAAAVLIAETAGCTVTDARGNSLGSTALFDTSEENIQSLVAATNPVLHRRLLDEVNEGMGRC